MIHRPARGRLLLHSKYPPARRRCHTAFTLLEALVVVAIMALLMTILVPSLAGARRQTRRVACQTQLHQLVVAWHLYLDAHAGRFPHGSTLSVDYGGKRGFAETYKQPKPLNPYLDVPSLTTTGAEIFHCPADREGMIEAKGTLEKSAMTCFDYYGTSYKTNRILVGTALPISLVDPCAPVLGKVNNRILSFTRSQIFDEPRLLLLGDFGWEDAWNLASVERVEWHGRPGWYNIGFMDGHAEFTPIYKGIYVDTRYTVLPFRDLQSQAAALQKPQRSH